MSPPSPLEIRFVSYLEGLVQREDRGALANLRRGLGKEPGTAAEMYPYVVPWAPQNDEDRFYLVASLFALHPSSGQSGSDHRRNFGASFAGVRGKTESESIELRFVALLNRPFRDFGDHLRHGVSLCKAHEVSVDWAQLLHDLHHWGAPSRSVQRDWARSFWGASTETGPNAGAAKAG